MKSKYLFLMLVVLAASPLCFLREVKAEEAISKTRDSKVVAQLPNRNSDSKVSLYQQLDELRSQNAILTESLKNAELKNKINDSGNGIIVPSISSSYPSVPGQSRGQSSDSNTSYQVQLVSGSQGSFSAILSVPGGGRITVHVGSIVPNLGIVKSINLNDVEISAKSQTINLPFAAESTTSTTGAFR